MGDRRQAIDQCIETLKSNPRFMSSQNENIARMVLFFDGLCRGLEGKAPSESLHQVAATLTAGYWASPD